MMKPNKYGEQLKKAKKKAMLQEHLLALEEVKEAEVKVNSMFFPSASAFSKWSVISDADFNQ